MSDIGQQRTGVVLAGVVLIVLVCFVVYIPAMRAGFVWDDDVYVQNNKMLRSPDGLRRIWFSLEQPSQYFPMVYTTFRFEYALWQLNPHGYHITNVLLHAINVLLLWWLLRRLSIPAALLAALIFALHPVHVESVAWITERKNMLMAFFYLLSLMTWDKFADRSHQSQRAWPFYILSFLLYAMALFSKTTACTLPVALVLCLWLKHIPLNPKRWLQLLPYVLLGLAMGIFTIWFENQRQGTVLLGLGLNPIDRVLIASRALWFYIGKLLWPVDLTFSYPQWKIDPTGPLQYGWLIACLIAAWALWRWREKIGRGSIAAIVFFVATLFPMLGFVSLYTFLYTYVADHYQYVASIGPITLVAALGCRIAERLGKWAKTAALIIAVFILMIFAVLTWRQSCAYKDLETLWCDTIRKNPDAWLAHNNLGHIMTGKGNFDQAVKHFNEALRVRPGAAKIHVNLGSVLTQTRKFEQAIEHYNEALRLEPELLTAHYNLAQTLLLQGRLPDAVEHFTEAVRIDPNMAEPHYHLAKVLARQGRLQDAIEHFNEALRIRQNSAMAHHGLAQALVRIGKTGEAIKHFQKALFLNPRLAGAMNDLARLLAVHNEAKFHNPEVAIQLARRACEITKYEKPDFLDTLALACAAAGKFPQAVLIAEQALKLAESSKRTHLTEEIQKRLLLYRKDKSYSEPLPK